MKIARHKSQATRGIAWQIRVEMGTQDLCQSMRLHSRVGGILASVVSRGRSLRLSFPAEAVVITPSFGSSITGNVKAAAIEAHRARPFAH